MERLRLTLSANVAYTGATAPTGALTFRVDTGAVVTGCLYRHGVAADLHGDLLDRDLDGWVAYDHGDGCGRC